MKQAILDTSFILSCIKNKIDFFEEIKFMGMKIIIPVQVLDEIKRFSRIGRGAVKQEAKLALLVLENQDYKRVDLYEKNADKGIIRLAKENPDLIIATLDTGIKNQTKNRILVIRGKKELEIV